MNKVADQFKPGKPGFGCKAGKLYRFEKRSVLVLAPWPEPQAWFKSHRKGWHSSRKRADKVFSNTLFSKDWIKREGYGFIGGFTWDVWLGDPAKPQPGEVEQYKRYHGKEPKSPEDILAHRQKIRETNEWCEKNKWAVRYVRKLLSPYFDAMPDEVREELSRYKNRRWHLFCLFARCPGALELSWSNPALCYALASNWVFHKPAVKRPMEAARRLIGKKQRHILGWLGFPGTESVRRIMAKVDPQALNIKRFLAFRGALQNPSIVKWLSRLERINVEVMDMAAWREYHPFLSAGLLMAFSREKDWRKLSDAKVLFNDTVRMARKLPGVHPRRTIQTLRQLKVFHDHLVQEQNLQWMRDRLAERGVTRLDFPRPPFAGTPAIQPIRDTDSLQAEGVEMNHCVAIRMEWALGRRSFFYRVLAPVRATMEVNYSTSMRKWIPGELKGKHNGSVPDSLKDLLFAELFAGGPYIGEPEFSGQIAMGAGHD